MTASKRHQRQQGSVLLVVLWLLVMLSLIAQGLAQRSGGHVTMARAQIELVQENLRAQAGVLHGALLLLDPGQSLPPRRSLVGEDAPVIFGAPVDIEIIDECGRIDLNTGRASMITSLFTGLGHPEHAAGQASAVLDWRDPGSRTRQGGAERDAYRAAGRHTGPRDGPFESVAELHQVLGLDAATVARVRPYLTVDCLNAGVDPMAASETLLRLLPSQTNSESLEAYLDRREQANRNAGGEMLWPPGLEKYVAPSDGHAYGIKARSRGDISQVAWSAVVWPGNSADRALSFRTWGPDRTELYATKNSGED